MKINISIKDYFKYIRRFLLQSIFVPVFSKNMFINEQRTLIVAPHQDDETLGCGGFIALKRRIGADIYVVFVTDGSKSHSYCAHTRQCNELIAVRREEALAALTVLGVPEQKVCFLSFPDGELSNLLEHPAEGLTLIRALADVIQWYKPEVILIPHPHDGHPDHHAAYRASIAAVNGTEQSPLVYAYSVWLFWTRNRLFMNLKGRDLRAAYHLETQEVASLKDCAMSKYVSQLEVLPERFVAEKLAFNEFFFQIRK